MKANRKGVLTYLIAMVGNNDDRPLERDLLAKVDVSRDGEMVQLDDVRDGGETLEEVAHLLEVLVAELDERGRLEHAVGVHGEIAVLQGVEVAHDQQQI